MENGIGVIKKIKGLSLNQILAVFQVASILIGFIASVRTGSILVFVATTLFVLTVVIKKRVDNRKPDLSSEVPQAKQGSVNIEQYLKDLENHLDSSIRSKMKIIPVLSEQLKSVIAQTDEAAGGLSTAFMGISRQAKGQLNAVQGLFGNLSEQSSNNNILLQTQTSLQEIQDNFSSITSFFDKSITLVNEIADQLGQVDEFARQITKIGKTTNILAINASIEAASFGAAGNGFKVIASEMKELSQSSNRSVSEIQGITDRLATKVASIKQELENVRQHADGIATRTDALFSETTGTLGATLQDTAEKMEIIAKDAQGLSKEVSRAVVSIQFQDITRQQIEHVISPLEALNNEITDTIDKLIKKELDLSQVQKDTLADSLMKQYTMESEREILKKFNNNQNK